MAMCKTKNIYFLCRTNFDFKAGSLPHRGEAKYWENMKWQFWLKYSDEENPYCSHVPGI